MYFFFDCQFLFLQIGLDGWSEACEQGYMLTIVIELFFFFGFLFLPDLKYRDFFFFGHVADHPADYT